jgi:hypothetical protein
MGNKGWDSQQSGGGVPSNARTTGRTSGVGDAEQFVQGSKLAAPGNENDPMDKRSDLFERPGQMGTC